MPVVQLALALQAEPTEHPAYLTDQLITYIGNKRGLLPFIGSGLTRARQLIGRDEVTFLDLFAGSGVVSRYAKQVSRPAEWTEDEMFAIGLSIATKSVFHYFSRYGDETFTTR